MVDNGSGDLKKQLTGWIDHVRIGVEKKLIGCEQDLEKKVRVLSESDRAKAQYDTGVNPPSTLLEILGYSETTCDDHPVITYMVTGTKLVKIIPDYIVKNNDQKDLAIWELKAPSEDIDSKEYADQLMSYCTEPKRQTPIGLLFNGMELRLFINPDYPGLSKYKKISDLPNSMFDFRCSPVLSIGLTDAGQNDKPANKAANDVFVGLSAAILSVDVVAYAKKLAEKKLSDIKNEKINSEIVACLQDALGGPTDEVIRAVAATIQSWKDFDTSPSPDDAVRAWHKIKSVTKLSPTVKTIETQAKQSINSIVRQMVIEICSSEGYDFLIGAKVKGLRMRNKGGNGYHPVPVSEGVPQDLYIGGLSTEDAKKVIHQLKLLIGK